MCYLDEIVLESNSGLKDRVANSKMPKVLQETVTITGELGTYGMNSRMKMFGRVLSRWLNNGVRCYHATGVMFCDIR